MKSPSLKQSRFSTKISHPSAGIHRKKRFLYTVAIRVLGACLILCVLGFFGLWATIIRTIPPLENLQNGNYFRESTIIYDSNGQEIYNLYKDGKRTYVPYEKISQIMKDAIISTEDRTFFENPGFDIRGLARAGINYVLGKTDKIKGTSTLSQQLISVTLLSKERSIKRKLQEAYLSYRLNKEYSKEQILEMYLNAISFGSNANGIEQASRTFFGKSANELGPLSAAILASLPKGPTYYSPYVHRDRLMGGINIYATSDSANTHNISTDEERETYQKLYGDFQKYMSELSFDVIENTVRTCGVKKEFVKNEEFSPDNEGCIDLSFDQVLSFIGSIAVRGKYSFQNETVPRDYIAEYMIGRKDFVAAQMLEDKKIDGPTFKKILYDGLSFTFKKYVENIKYPHFVMFVREYLEEKYGKDLDITNGLKIYTTVDSILQEKAEELIGKQVEINKKQFGANSAALISMDNKNGRLLSMVGGPDYFDTENGGNNNMTLALRQPGSSFKPLIYALAIAKNPIGPETPIADVKTKFGNWEPNNYDMHFNGIMTVKTALDYSRNIPAAKMFYLAGGEDEIVKFWKEKGGLMTLKENAGYGAPLAIGAGEVRPIDLMQAYSVFANNGIKRDLYFIQKIEDNDGNIIEEHKTPSGEPDPILLPAAAYIISTILSDNNARPESSFWRNALTIPGRIVAAKTGTSNKEISENKILPRDLWTAGYTPQITTVVWAGNVNGKETKGTCDGLNCAAPIWKGYMDFALKKLPKEDFSKPKDVFSYSIVKTSGRLATNETPKDQVVSTIMANKLTEYDTGFKEMQIDTLCNGPVSENTPAESIKTIYIPSANPVIDGYDPEWTRGFFEALRMGTTTLSGSATHGTINTTFSDAPCERPSGPGDISISLDFVGNNAVATSGSGRKTLEIGWIGNRELATLRVKYQGEVKREIFYGTGGKKNGKERIAISLPKGSNTIDVEIVDIFGFLYHESKTFIVGDDAIPGTDTGLQIGILAEPTITMTNPKGKTLSLYTGDAMNVRFQVDVTTANREIVVTLDNKPIYTATSGDIFVVPISSDGISIGTHSVKIQLTDGNYRTTSKAFSLTILAR